MPALKIGDMGPGEIVWKYGESGALYLGETHGGIKLKMDTGIKDVVTDQAGDAAVDAGFQGSTMTLEANLTRSSYDILNEVLLAGGILGTPPHEYIKLKNQIGCFMYSLASRLVIKPVCSGVVSTDPAEWTEIYKAYPIPAVDLTWDPATQRIFPVKFKIFVSQDSGYVSDFGTLGMPSGSTEFGI